MNADKSKISKFQFLFIVACFIQSSALLSSFLTVVTYNETWLVIIIAIFISLILMIIYYFIIKKFPNKNLIEITYEVFGKYLGFIINLFYLWFFITLTSLNIMDLTSITSQSIMNNTPQLLILVFIVIVCAYSVKNGISNIGRYSSIFTVVAIFINIISILLLKNQIEIKHFLPVFSLPFNKYIQSIHICLSIPLGELIVMLMITPKVNCPDKEKIKAIYIGFIIGSLTFLLVTLRDIAILGNTYHLFTVPSLVAYRLVSISENISRIEILFVIVLVMLLMFKIIILYYVSINSLSYIFKINNYKNLILIFGIFVIWYGISLVPDPIKHLESTHDNLTFVWSFVEFFLPLLTIIVSLFKRKKEKI